jgi:hypothetical protein
MKITAQEKRLIIKRRSVKKVIAAKVDQAKFEKLVTDVQEFTSNNDHNEARLEIAKFFKFKKFEKLFNAMITIQTELNNMPESAIKLRNEITNSMLKAIEQNFGKDIKDQIYQEM